MKQLAKMIAALCLFVTLLVLRELPAVIPAHYDFAGNVTRYGSKYELLILPVILLLVSFGSRFLLLHLRRKAEQAGSDKERQAAAANAKVVVIVIFSQTLILSCIQGVVLYNTVLALRGESFLSTFAGEKLLTILCGSLLLVPGNILPKCRRNGMVGFRLPWTKYNDITWQKSGEDAGRGGSARDCEHCLCAEGLRDVLTVCLYYGGNRDFDCESMAGVSGGKGKGAGQRLKQ